ncbi:MAG: DUF2169 domain-containing protein [Polyangiaceae bacterium]
MRFVNDTELAAGLLRSERPNDVMLGAVIVRERFVIVDGKRLERAPLEGIRTGTVELGEYGILEADEVAPRVGTDVIVLGSALCPKPTIATRVEVSVGPYDVKLDVFGDRVWEGPGDALIPSAPVPFDHMPIIYARAFGGPAPGEYGTLPYYKNPTGKGFYLRSGDARGKPLPNIEWADKHLDVWDGKPDPAGLAPYPATWGLRTEKTVIADIERESIEVEPEGGLYDRAHPALSGKLVEPGPLAIKGMTPSGYLQVELPPCSATLFVELGEQAFERALSLEEILVDLRDLARPTVELSYRKMFRYPFVREQRRQARLVPRAPSQGA